MNLIAVPQRNIILHNVYMLLVWIWSVLLMPGLWTYLGLGYATFVASMSILYAGTEHNSYTSQACALKGCFYAYVYLWCLTILNVIVRPYPDSYICALLIVIFTLIPGIIYRKRAALWIKILSFFKPY